MDSILELYRLITSPEQIIQTGGLLLILLIIFTENGVFFGFFLPGDTLLFTTGLLSATGYLNTSIYLLLVTISGAAIFGSMVGYYFGKKTGDTLFQREDSLLFKKKYLIAAEAFFKRHGGLALVMGRFLPIIRTFAPIFAGIAHFEYPKFMYYNILGAILWVFSMLLSGFFIGMFIPNSKDYLEYLILGIVIITWIPVILTYLKERKKMKQK